MVPVPAVARDPRSLETKHRSNVPGAQPGDEALETGPRDGAVGRQALIVVYDFDPGEAVSARHINEIVLAALALQIVPHLLGRGLTDINHGLARQHRSRQRFSGAHRHPPSPGRPPLPEAIRPVRSPLRAVPPGSDRAASVRRAAGRAVGGLPLVQAKTSSTSSPLTVPSSGELCRKPWPTRSSCSAARAAGEARGAPISMPAHDAGSSIQAGILTISPGSTSTEAREPPARCSIASRPTCRPHRACQR